MNKAICERNAPDLCLRESERRGEFGSFGKTEILSLLEALGQLLNLNAGVDGARLARLLLAAALHHGGCGGGRPT